MKIQFGKLLAVVVMSMGLVACGGGGGSSGTGTSGSSGSGGTTVAKIELLKSSNQLSSGSGDVQLTVTVKDASNNALSGKSVSFSSTSGTLASIVGTTDASGVATAKLSAGADKSNRDIVVTATSGSVSATTTVVVTGSALSMTGVSTVQTSKTATFTVQVLDSAGKAVDGVTVSFASTLGGLSSSSGTTNSLGNASVVYTAPASAGSDTISAQALGASAAQSIVVSGVGFAFTSPSAGTNIALNTNQTFTVQVPGGGVYPVSFSTTRGTFVSRDTSTNASGIASAVLQSSTAGPATVGATLNGGAAQATINATFVSQTPSTLVVQANPSALAPNTSGSSTQQAQVYATVRDAVGNPVANKQVDFTLVTDLSGGNITAFATTDSSGKATAVYTAGTGTTASNGVQIQATVSGTAVSGTTYMTVDRKALFISLGTDNTISNLDAVTYEKQWRVYVTDANGVAVPSTQVTLDVVPIYYGKGSLAWNGTNWATTGAGFNVATSVTTGTTTVPTYTTTTGVMTAGYYVSCSAEDVDADGTLDAGEDYNSDGFLTPPNPVLISSGVVTTDTNGIASFSLRYAEDKAKWLQVMLRARAVVSGTESTASVSYALEGASSDYTSEAIAPAGRISPYGTQYQCSDYR